MRRLAWCLALLVLLAAVPALAYDGPVEKKAFSMPFYTTVGGPTIKDVRVGYETYGTLNDDGGFGVGPFQIRATAVDGQVMVDAFDWPGGGITGAFFTGAGNFQ